MTRAPYELRASKPDGPDLCLEIWRLPGAWAPELTLPRRLAGLHGRNLAFFLHRLQRQLLRLGVDLSDLSTHGSAAWPLDEEHALRLGLFFRTLAPMRSPDAMRACAEGIESMTREEAAYWLGMAMHRKHPRRVLSALRLLLIADSRPAA